MESLSDELFLTIFRYLHEFDIVYAFSNLSQRFHSLTQANISHQRFCAFYQNILSHQYNKTRSLQLLQLHVYLLIDLESLTLILTVTHDFILDELSKYSSLNLHACPDFKDVSSMPHVKHLSITVKPINTLEKVFEAMPDLEKLVLSVFKFSGFKDI
ncbi:unnamed protein product [Adineta ricciae]|uniref:F-box domain-containing protein n=1 Tax=Adineta ricciae TaxID=249248 RepID=A0A813UTX2_ADIRI|nr:unnamed protein product [Adineta ricciae]CAF0977944.1 unnamed protein product [Adineta ricciae]